ncbi:unnamed protein product [Nesidiocoris tenuis]|uniref:Uncharacterized protein n=1 Tax=Nesidiocoris tenuis TaxID=355587 RepID=A0A6H5H7F7_9HEMI|nr:unnamed protein product [Nesidiocoris tenuis]
MASPSLATAGAHFARQVRRKFPSPIGPAAAPVSRKVVQGSALRPSRATRHRQLHRGAGERVFVPAPSSNSRHLPNEARANPNPRIYRFSSFFQSRNPTVVSEMGNFFFDVRKRFIDLRNRPCNFTILRHALIPNNTCGFHGNRLVWLTTIDRRSGRKVRPRNRSDSGRHLTFPIARPGSRKPEVRPHCPSTFASDWPHCGAHCQRMSTDTLNFVIAARSPRVLPTSSGIDCFPSGFPYTRKHVSGFFSNEPGTDLSFWRKKVKSASSKEWPKNESDSEQLGRRQRETLVFRPTRIYFENTGRNSSTAPPFIKILY